MRFLKYLLYKKLDIWNSAVSAFFQWTRTIISNPKKEQIADLDSLPVISRDLFIDISYKLASISGSRGCTRNCGFCISHDLWKGKWRGRSIQNIVDEIENLNQTFLVRKISFFDSSLEDPDPDCRRLRELAEELVYRNIGIYYYANMRAEAYTKIDEELLDLLKKSGLSMVFLGIEAGNEYDLKQIYYKTASLTDNHNSVSFFDRNGIPVSIGFINFNPYSTFESLHQNIDFLNQYGFAALFSKIVSIFRMYKGERLYSKIRSDGLYKRSSMTDSYGYTFVDERIEWLSSFLSTYFEDQLYNNNLIKDTHVLVRDWYYPIFGPLLRHFENNQRNEELTIVREYKQSSKKLLDALSEINAGWFRALLDIAETSWDEKEAANILCNSLMSDEIHDLYTQLRNKQIGLESDLHRIDNEYADLL